MTTINFIKTVNYLSAARDIFRSRADILTVVVGDQASIWEFDGDTTEAAQMICDAEHEADDSFYQSGEKVFVLDGRTITGEYGIMIHKPTEFDDDGDPVEFEIDVDVVRNNNVVGYA